MSKAFNQFVNFYRNNSSNNYAVFSDYILFDELMLDFLDYPRELYFQNFKYFSKYALVRAKIPELLALYYFKFCHSTEVNIQKGKLVHHIISPYKERSRVISYPVNKKYNFFVTITFRSPFSADNNDVYSVIAFNDYLNSQIKRGFKRWRDNIRRHYYLELKRDFYNMSIDTLETFFGYVPTTKELNQYINQEATRMARETFYYFRVYETHKSNVIHCHALVQIPDFLTQMDFKELISLIASWFETEPNGVELDRIKNDKKGNGTNAVRNYILKYMFKQFKEDNLVYVDKSENERVFMLKTSAFVMNFIPRVISYSRGTQVKKFKPFSSYSLEELLEEFPDDFIRRDCSLLEQSIQSVNYEDYKLIIDRFKTMYEKKGYIKDKLQKKSKAVNIVYSYLRDEILLSSRSDDINWAIEWLRSDEKYSGLCNSALLKLNKDLDVVDF